MKAINKSLFPTLEVAIRESLKNYEANNNGHSLNDLYVFQEEDNEAIKFSIYDDWENLLYEIQLQKENIFNIATLRYIFQRLEHEKMFDRDYISKPFTVSLIDENFVVLEELIFMDDDTVKLEENIWTNLDKELDDFLKNLME